MRINVDRNSENKDELDIKAVCTALRLPIYEAGLNRILQGEIVFVDNTMFMGQRGKWRAWKVDREGRQRENGIIPSATHMERTDVRGKKAKVQGFPSTDAVRLLYYCSNSFIFSESNNPHAPDLRTRGTGFVFEKKTDSVVRPVAYSHYSSSA